MANEIEVRAFMWLAAIFRERGWPNPRQVEVNGVVGGRELLARLAIPEEKVEAIFVNGKASPPTLAVINPGDRVALVSPGMPGPYRVLLGFKRKV